jgi:hypothetical protein
MHSFSPGASGGTQWIWTSCTPGYPILGLQLELHRDQATVYSIKLALKAGILKAPGAYLKNGWWSSLF